MDATIKGKLNFYNKQNQMLANTAADATNHYNYIINTKNTIRQTAKYFNKSKSTIHDDLHNKLKKIDKSLYAKVSDILNYHFLIKHIRGGVSTKLKYAKE